MRTDVLLEGFPHSVEWCFLFITRVMQSNSKLKENIHFLPLDSKPCDCYGSTTMNFISQLIGYSVLSRFKIGSNVSGQMILSRKRTMFLCFDSEIRFIWFFKFCQKRQFPFAKIFQKHSVSVSSGVAIFCSSIRDFHMSSSLRYCIWMSVSFWIFFSSSKNVVFPNPGSPKNSVTRTVFFSK